MRTEIFVQARMTSTRLPGKVLKPVLNRPLLGYLIERLLQVQEADSVVILTTTKSTDDPIAHFCDFHNMPYFRGPEEDVLTRYYQAALERKTDVIVRVTADCPLIDPEVIDKAISEFKEANGTVDYLSNSLKRTFPRGLDVEVFSFKNLKKAYKAANKPYEREHVTPYFYQHPNDFSLKNIECKKNLSKYRWTVDTEDDFKLISMIIEALYPKKPKFKTKDILELLKQHPDWNDINAHIEQKKLMD